MDKITFEEGTLITPAKVNEDGTITPAVWAGNTPLTPHTLNLMQTNIENTIEEAKKTNFITAYLSADYAVADSTESNIVLDKIQASYGANLSLENGYIVCKKAGTVEISAKWGITNGKEGGNTIPRVYLNNTCISEVRTRMAYNNAQDFSIAPKILKVEANAKIKMTLGNWSGQDNTVVGKQENTYISVKYIG